MWVITVRAELLVHAWWLILPIREKENQAEKTPVHINMRSVSVDWQEVCGVCRGVLQQWDVLEDDTFHRFHSLFLELKHQQPVGRHYTPSSVSTCCSHMKHRWFEMNKFVTALLCRNSPQILINWKTWISWIRWNTLQIKVPQYSSKSATVMCVLWGSAEPECLQQLFEGFFTDSSEFLQEKDEIITLTLEWIYCTDWCSRLILMTKEVMLVQDLRLVSEFLHSLAGVFSYVGSL